MNFVITVLLVFLSIPMVILSQKGNALIITMLCKINCKILRLTEFSLARYSDTAVYANNSTLDINLIGEGFEGAQITNGGALECHTDDTSCCRRKDDPLNITGRGEWYYPDGTVVPPPNSNPLIYRTRDHMVIRLNRVGGAQSLITGVYQCVIPGAGGVIITRYVTLERGGEHESIRQLILSHPTVYCDDLSSTSDGVITFVPPRGVSSELLKDKRYIGTIATYSCLAGYKLVGGSSLRACGLGGVWNGTEPWPSCGIRDAVFT